MKCLKGSELRCLTLPSSNLQCPSVLIWVFISSSSFCFSPSLSYKKSRARTDLWKRFNKAFICWIYESDLARWTEPNCARKLGVDAHLIYLWHSPEPLGCSLLRRPSLTNTKRRSFIFLRRFRGNTGRQVRSQEIVRMKSSFSGHSTPQGVK